MARHTRGLYLILDEFGLWVRMIMCCQFNSHHFYPHQLGCATKFPVIVITRCASKFFHNKNAAKFLFCYVCTLYSILCIYGNINAFFPNIFQLKGNNSRSIDKSYVNRAPLLKNGHLIRFSSPLMGELCQYEMKRCMRHFLFSM